MPTCKGQKVDGTPCMSPVVDEDGLCPAHTEGGRERMRERGKLGAEATKKKYAAKGLDPDELPPLVDHRAAVEWLEAIGRAVVSGQLAHRDATAGVKTIETWIKAQRGLVEEEDLEELRAQLEAIKDGKLKPLRSA